MKKMQKYFLYPVWGQLLLYSGVLGIPQLCFNAVKLFHLNIIAS